MIMEASHVYDFASSTVPTRARKIGEFSDLVDGVFDS